MDSYVAISPSSFSSCSFIDSGNIIEYNPLTPSRRLRCRDALVRLSSISLMNVTTSKVKLSTVAMMKVADFRK